MDASEATRQITDTQKRLIEAHPGLRLDLWVRGLRSTNGEIVDGSITIMEISLPETSRGEGIGTAVMDELCRLADELGVQLALTPDLVYGGSSVRRLREFSARFGFVSNTGRRLDPAISEAMRREPSLRPQISPLGDAGSGGSDMEPGSLRPGW
jgi:GNAT superfamily N-acetyltransferase